MQVESPNGTLRSRNKIRKMLGTGEPVGEDSIMGPLGAQTYMPTFAMFGLNYIQVRHTRVASLKSMSMNHLVCPKYVVLPSDTKQRVVTINGA